MNLSWNDIGDEGAMRILEMRTLNLSGNLITPGGAFSLNAWKEGVF